MDGLIDIEAGSLIVQAFNYPDITDEAIDKDIKRKKAMLTESFKTGKPLPEEIRRMIHETDTIWGEDHHQLQCRRSNCHLLYP